ncbi:MAG: glycerol-3-phosphate 1-O-acyltransferase PlsB [Gammaproteobacteria bacterium]|nr:glycerol-3-phosphate 1-O-acyltransferase PlsB [Gammaproteobacteria bacterium]
MKRQFIRLLRWILFLWVRVEVFPQPDPGATLDSTRPVLYVLADRGLSDLLVLTQVTQRHGFPDPLARMPIAELKRHHSTYSIASRSPVTDWVKRRRKHSPMLAEFMQAFSESGELDLQIVPVSVFWGRPLARHKHWLQALFADTWSLAGRTRRFFTILIHGRNARLIFSQAIDFRALLNDSENDEQDLQESLVTILRQQREATFGPQITSHKHLSAKVVEDAIVRDLITDESDNAAQASARAHRYCREIFADCTQLTIEVMLRLLRAFWNRFYSGIEVYNAERVRETALSHQLVYVPCHRSHVDYLLLSYVIYKENLAIPYIAAGDNLNIPFIGRILRGGGAFFIRRSFKDNPLYGAIMRSYIQQLVKLGVPLEYFIEGGRSRTGRLLKPRYGMLGMTLEAYIRSQARPMAFVPVYIGYEKLIEGKSYLGELYGDKKKKESTLGALGAIFRLKGHFGKVTASFGEPIAVADLLQQHCPDWADRAAEIEHKPDWYQASLRHLGDTIMQGIGRACVLNPVNSVATVLLATPRQSIEIEELINQSELQDRLIHGASCLASIRIEGKVDRRCIEHIAAQKIIHIHKHELGDIVYLKPEDTVLLGYYRNNILHTLIIPALLACCFTNVRRVSRASIERKIGLLYPFLKSELQLEWPGAELGTIVDEFITCLINESLLEEVGKDLRRPRRSDHRFIQLIRLAHIVQPILERYYMTFIVLWHASSDPLDEADLEHRCHLLAQKISMIYGINAPDFFDRPLFHDFIENMLDNEYLVRNDQQQLQFTPGFDYVSLDLRNLLSTEVRGSILSIIKTIPHKAPSKSRP